MDADRAKAEPEARQPIAPRGSPLRWNLMANFGGQAWRALMALAFVPFYVRILGVEAYGLIGLYTGLQLALGLLDAGLRPTLAREMARFTAGAMDAAGIRTLLRSIELPLAAIAAVIVMVMALAAPWLATHWIRAGAIPSAAVAQAFTVMGLVAGLQLLESAYDSSLAGLQRQVLQNAIVTFIATLRGFGALAVIWHWPSVSAFFLWQAAVALASLAICRFALHRSLPPAPGSTRFSGAALLGLRGFALGMLAQSLVALLLGHSDRLLLARMVPLRELGEYAVAAAVASAMAFVSVPVGGAFLPRFTELAERGDHAALRIAFQRAGRLIVLLAASFAAMCAVFGERLLQLWLHDAALATRTAPLLALLVLGNMFSSVAYVINLVQLAHGRTRTILQINLAMLAMFLPTLFVLVRAHGASGAAMSWMLVNLAGMVVSVSVTLRRYLPGEALRWWLGGFAALTAAVSATAFLLQALLPRMASPLAEAGLLAAAGAAVLACGVLADREMRCTALRLARSAFAG